MAMPSCRDPPNDEATAIVRSWKHSRQHCFRIFPFRIEWFFGHVNVLCLQACDHWIRKDRRARLRTTWHPRQRCCSGNDRYAAFQVHDAQRSYPEVAAHYTHTKVGPAERYCARDGLPVGQKRKFRHRSGPTGGRWTWSPKRCHMTRFPIRFEPYPGLIR